MFQFPINVISVSSRFVMYTVQGRTTMHYGLDCACNIGTPLYAAHDGTVIGSFYDNAGGYMLIIQGQNKLSRYAHLSSRVAKINQTVERGQLIGYAGNTGSATTGPHLHFETWVTPDNYVYSYSDRTRYAVDPMAVCHLMPGQEFYNPRGLSMAKPIPYPEPDIPATSVTGTITVFDGDVRFRTIPETDDYQYVVGGYNRSKTVFGDFFNVGVYPIVAICKNVYDWALVDTGRGLFWVSELSGRTKINVDTPPTPEPDRYTVEIQSVLNKAEADELLKQLETAGYSAVIKKI